MSTAILNKYDIAFFKNADGYKFPDNTTALSSYLSIWRTIADIDDFLVDIDLCLSGKFNQIEDPHYDDSRINLYGELTADTLILSSRGTTSQIIIPLIEFRELLLAWREFLFSKIINITKAKLLVMLDK